MKPHNVRFTDAARAAATELKEEGYALRFSVRAQGCCNLSIRIFPVPDPTGESQPDPAARQDEKPPAEAILEDILIVDGIRIFFDNEYPDFTWVGTIDYKEKGLHKGFHWK